MSTHNAEGLMVRNPDGSERACTRHSQTPVEAEAFVDFGLTYRMLRCPICNRPQGARLIRKNRVS